MSIVAAVAPLRVTTTSAAANSPTPPPPHIDVQDVGYELDDSMSDIREALDHAFSTLPTPPPVSSPANSLHSHGGSGSLEQPHSPSTGGKRTLLTTTNLAESNSSALQAKKRNSSAAASIISTASSGIRHTHRGPAPTRPPQCPLPPPPSSPLSSTAGTPQRPTLSLKRDDKGVHSFDSGVAMQSKQRATAKHTSRSASPESSAAGRRLLTPEPARSAKAQANSSKRPSTSSILTDMTSTTTGGSADTGSVTSKRVWRISSTGQHYLDDDDFTAAFGSPSLAQLTGQYGHETAAGAADRQHDEDEDGNSRGYLTPSATASPRSARSSSTAQFPTFQHRGPLLLSETTSLSKTGGESLAQQLLSPPPNGSTAARRPSVQGLPYVSKPLVSQPYNSTNSTSATSTATAAAAALREQKMALLRARQQELLREQEQLEALEREEQEAAEAESAAARAAADAASEDTDMHDRSDDQEEHSRAAAANRTHVQSLRSKRSLRAPETSASAQEALDDLATEFEVASLRAQVTQLQLALKRQMSTSTAGGDTRRSRSSNGSSGNNHTSHFRMGAPMAEFMGVPTPEESFAGSSMGLSNDGGLSRLPHGTSAKHRQGPAADDYDWRHPAGGVRHQSNHGSSTVSSSRPSAYAGPGDSASQVTSGDVRVDELAVKLARLEELFRLTALQQHPHAGHNDMLTRHDTDSSSTISPHHHHHQSTHMPAGSHPDNHNIYSYEQHASQHGPVRTLSQNSASSSYAHSYSSFHNRSPTVLSAFNYNATTPSGARYSPESIMLPPGYPQQGQQQQSPLHARHGDGATSLSVPTQQTVGGQPGYEISPSSSISSGLSGHAGKTNGTGFSSSRATKVEHVRRKGVARFILGSSTTRLIDAQGGAVVPSMPVSMSRSRTDRVEKLPSKIKVKQGAGRGRVTVVQKKATAATPAADDQQAKG